MEENIINKIESEQPRLSSHERSILWQRIETSLLSGVQPVVSPYNFFITLNYKTMTAFALVLLLVITGGGTAYASNAARPGDTLYTVDRALEDIQLRLAVSDDSKNKLTQKLTQERLQELRDIIEEETIVSESNSTDDELATFKDGGQVRVSTAVDAILRFLDDTSSDDISRRTVQTLIQKELVESMDVRRDANSTRIGNDGNRIKIRMDDDGDSRFEIREGASRVRIEEKNGEVRIKTEDEDESDDGSVSRDISNLKNINDILEVTADQSDDSLFDRDDKDEDLNGDVSGRDDRHEDSKDGKDKDREEDI
jgi:hypothetical protein